MAQYTEVKLVDDLHTAAGELNVPADETVAFALDGKDYEIDLTADHAAGLRAAFEQYVTAGRTAKHQAKPRKARAASGDRAANKAIREWCIAQGMDVKPRGRLNKEHIEAYKAAHSDQAPAAQPETTPAL